MNVSTINQILGFRKFKVYQDIRILRKNLKIYSKLNFPKEERYRLNDQLWRALDSMLLNVAEGSEKCSSKHQSHFYGISIASTAEVAACIDAAFDDEYLSKDTQQKLLISVSGIMKQLRTLYAHIRHGRR